MNYYHALGYGFIGYLSSFLFSHFFAAMCKNAGISYPDNDTIIHISIIFGAAIMLLLL